MPAGSAAGPGSPREQQGDSIKSGTDRATGGRDSPLVSLRRPRCVSWCAVFARGETAVDGAHAGCHPDGGGSGQPIAVGQVAVNTAGCPARIARGLRICLFSHLKRRARNFDHEAAV